MRLALSLTLGGTRKPTGDAAPPATPDERITEDGDTRITEDGDTREIES